MHRSPTEWLGATVKEMPLEDFERDKGEAAEQGLTELRSRSTGW